MCQSEAPCCNRKSSLPHTWQWRFRLSYCRIVIVIIIKIQIQKQNTIRNTILPACDSLCAFGDPPWQTAPSPVEVFPIPGLILLLCCDENVYECWHQHPPVPTTMILDIILKIVSVTRTSGLRCAQNVRKQQADQHTPGPPRTAEKIQLDQEIRSPKWDHVDFFQTISILCHKRILSFSNHVTMF